MTIALGRRILAEKRTVIVPIAAALLVNILAYALWVYPLRGQVSAAERREASARQALAQAQREHRAAQSLVFGKDQAANELKTFYTDVLPADLSGARRITHVRLAELARDANLRHQRTSFEPKEARGSKLTRLEITLVLEGTYESVREFLYRVETAEEFIVIDNLVLTQGTELNSPLVLTLSLSTYFRNAGNAP
jgi:Tfp pilus assembly protein PilO